LPLITGSSEEDVPFCDGADAGNIIWMPVCGCGKYAVKLAEAFAGMHGRAVQVTTVPMISRLVICRSQVRASLGPESLRDFVC
jgi:hypothetical protein